MIDKMHVEPHFSRVINFMKKHRSIILVIYIGKAWLIMTPESGHSFI